MTAFTMAAIGLSRTNEPIIIKIEAEGENVNEVLGDMLEKAEKLIPDKVRYSVEYTGTCEGYLLFTTIYGNVFHSVICHNRIYFMG